MNWKEKAIKLLDKSLKPVPQELNEIDWKGGLSDDKERLAQHICAFSNLAGGGLLVYEMIFQPNGINCCGVEKCHY